MVGHGGVTLVSHGGENKDWFEEESMLGHNEEARINHG